VSPFWRRGEPAHRRLGRALPSSPADGFSQHPPLLDGTHMGEPAIHGVSRPRRWDAVVTAESEALVGDQVHFVALPDGTLVVDEDVPDGSLAPLAEAVEEAVEPPYRAQGVRKSDRVWAIAVHRVEIASLPDVRGDEIELTVRGGERALVVDGGREFGGMPALERLAGGRHDDYAVRAERIDGDLFEIKIAPL
jgi:hypothetical protein